VGFAMTNNIKALRFLLLLAVIFTTPLSTATQEKTIGEDTLKALYSYKFALFTEWPDAKLNANDGLGFCIAGKNSFSPTALTSIEGKLVKEKSLHIEVFENGLLSEESLDSCFILFVSSSETQRFPAILNAIRQLPILTISDIQGFSNHNGMITLVKSGDHIQFEINPDAIRQAGLSISSKIIELATILVKTKKDGGNQ
jgi:YfiR/HmsC-like